MGLLVWHLTNTRTYELLASSFCMCLTLVLHMGIRISPGVYIIVNEAY